MKRLLLLIFLTGAVHAGFAQEKTKVKPVEDLKLTEQQDKQVKDINRSYINSTREVWKDKALSKADKKTKLDALGADRSEKLKSVLDADQFAKWQSNRASAGERFKDARRKGMHKKNDAETLKEIGLSDADGEELKSINKDFKSKAVALKDNSGLSREQKQQEMKKLNDERLTKIKTTLGEEKYARYDEHRKKEREKIKSLRRQRADKKTIQ